MVEPVSLRLGAFRADHAIAVGRVLLAAVALADIVLDATPLAEQKLAAAILGGYTLYALAVHAIVWRRELPGGRFGLAAHVIDLVTFTVLMSLTEGPTSLLYVLLTFALLSAKLRWQWRGVLWTSAACLAILAGLQAQAVLLSTGAGARAWCPGDALGLPCGRHPDAVQPRRAAGSGPRRALAAGGPADRSPGRGGVADPGRARVRGRRLRPAPRPAGVERGPGAVGLPDPPRGRPRSARRGCRPTGSSAGWPSRSRRSPS